MKKRLKEMEDEAAALREMQAKVEKEMGAQGFRLFDFVFLVFSMIRFFDFIFPCTSRNSLGFADCCYLVFGSIFGF